MNMIDELRRYEKNNLDDWFDLDDSKQKEFLRSIVNYFESNETELISYCSALKPKEFSSLSLIYEAVSVYSFKFNNFIVEEVKRVIELAKKNVIKPNRIEVLEDFELEDLYEKDYSNYKKIINSLIDSLAVNQSDKLNKSILELLDYYLIESDEEDEEYTIWQNQIENFISLTPETVKKNITQKKRGINSFELLKSSGLFWQVLFFLGLVSQVMAISYFRKTVIDTKVSVGLYLIIGIAGLIIFNKRLKTHYNSLFYRIIFSVVSFGGTFVALFLFLNYNIASKEVESEKYEIIEKSSIAGSKYNRSERKPTVYIIMNDIKKEIVYPYSKTLEVEQSKYLIINKSKGLFGFDTIRSKELE